jgi:NAD(P)-dependent dehydrogenase (short-subunit alcohol dehydrogenase family)
MDLRNSVALLTGASRGIGPQIARALVREGAHVAVAAIGLRPGSRLGGTCARLALERRCEVPWPTGSDSCFPA